MPTVTCCQCGKDFHAPPSKAKRNIRNYCSKKCQSTKPIMTCEQCGKKYETQRAWIRQSKHHFCSMKCKGLWYRGKRLYTFTPEHKQLFREIQLAKTELNEWRRNHLKKLHEARIGMTLEEVCGPERAAAIKEQKRQAWLGDKNPAYGSKQSGKKNHNWKGGKSFQPYDSAFNEQLKQLIRKRDGYECKLCGMTQEEHITTANARLTIHHIDYDKQNSIPSNLICLCRDCNSRANSNRNYHKRLFTAYIAGIDMHQLIPVQSRLKGL